MIDTSDGDHDGLSTDPLLGPLKYVILVRQMTLSFLQLVLERLQAMQM